MLKNSSDTVKPIAGRIRKFIPFLEEISLKVSETERLEFELATSRLQASTLAMALRDLSTDQVGLYQLLMRIETLRKRQCYFHHVIWKTYRIDINQTPVRKLVINWLISQTTSAFMSAIRTRYTTVLALRQLKLSLVKLWSRPVRFL